MFRVPSPVWNPPAAKPEAHFPALFPVLFPVRSPSVAKQAAHFPVQFPVRNPPVAKPVVHFPVLSPGQNPEEVKREAHFPAPSPASAPGNKHLCFPRPVTWKTIPPKLNFRRPPILLPDRSIPQNGLAQFSITGKALRLPIRRFPFFIGAELCLLTAV